MGTNASSLIHEQYRKTAAGALPRGIIAISMNIGRSALMLERYAI